MDGIEQTVTQLFASIITPFLLLGIGLATSALAILSLAAAVRGVLMIIETMLDEKSTSTMLAQLARGGAAVLIFMVALGSWAGVQGFVLSFTSDATTAAARAMGIDRPPVFSVPGGMDTPPAGLVAQQVAGGVLFSSLEELIKLTYRVERLYKLRTLVAGVADAQRQEPPPGVDLDTWIEQQILELESREDSRSLMDQVTGYMGALIPAIQGQIAYLTGIVCVLIFAIVALYYLMGSLFAILVALGVGPVAVAVAPLESAFAKNLGALLLSSALQFALVANMTVMLSTAINELALYYLANARLASGLGATMLEVGAAQFLIPLLCVVFAFLMPKVLGAITEIFNGSSAKPGGVMKLLAIALAAKKLIPKPK